MISHEVQADVKRDTVTHGMQTNRYIEEDGNDDNEKDVQCNMTEIDSGVDGGMVERAISAANDTLGTQVRERELQIIEHGDVGTQADIGGVDLLNLNPGAVDFECQFSYHTAVSTEPEREERQEPESELHVENDELTDPPTLQKFTQEESEESEYESIPQLPESLSSHPEQLSQSEQEKITVYRCQIPDFSHLDEILKRKDKNRPNSVVFSKKYRDVERHLLLLNRPFLPKYIKHKKNRSENASEVSEEMNEERYYKEKYDNDEQDEEEYPEYILDAEVNDRNDRNDKKRGREEIKNPAFVSSKSPSLRDCDVTRAIKKPTAMDKVNKIKEGVYLPKELKHLPESNSRKSIESYPVRLNQSNESDNSDQQRDNSDFETPEEVEQLYNQMLKNTKSNSQFPKVTTVSQNSKHTNPQDSRRETQRDWVVTSLYEDFERFGQTDFNSKNDPNFYTEDEINNVYEFVKSRYNTKEYDRSVTSFYQKAMRTLESLMSSMGLTSMFNNIAAMYDKVSVTNTLKLIIR